MTEFTPPAPGDEQVTTWITETDVAVVMLNAPDRRNSLSFSMVDQIVAAVDHAEDNAGAIVVTGAPPAFCAGAVLDTLINADETSLRRIYDGFLRVAASPLPTIAAVNGAAVGAGVNLALACDVRLVSERAKFIARFSGLGITPGGGHTWMLQQLVGHQGAMAMNMFGDELSGPESVTAGLAWRCLPDDQLLETAIALASTAAATPPPLRERLAAVLAETAQLSDHQAAVDAELVHQAATLATPEAHDAIAALAARISAK